MVGRHTSRDAELNVPSSSASGGSAGSRVLRSNASVCQQPKSKREDKEAENELHVGGLRRPSQTLLLVPGWETTGRRLWDCIDASLSDDTDASGLTRLYGQADFQGPKSDSERVRLGTSLEAQAIFRVAQLCPGGYPLWRDASSRRPRRKHLQDGWCKAHRWAWTEG